MPIIKGYTNEKVFFRAVHLAKRFRRLRPKLYATHYEKGLKPRPF